MISRWKLEYEKNPEFAFIGGNGNTYKDEALERLVGKLYAETEFLKKAVSALEKKAQKDMVKLKAERNS